MAEDEVIYQGEQYTLRAGAPMPIGGGNIKLHTFMAEKYEFDIILYTTELKGSDDFRGNGGDAISASYSRLSDISGEVFSGKVTYDPEIIEEDEIPQ